MHQTIKDILASSGYSTEGMDNRNTAVKSLNAVLQNSEIKIAICQKGKVWTHANQSKYNVKISLAGISTNGYYIDVTPYKLLTSMGSFLRIDAVKAKIYSETSEPHTCSKCEGKGFIEAFSYYANGVCFDCLGCGFIGKLMVAKVQDRATREKFGMPYINTFYVSGNYAEAFPHTATRLQAVQNIDHPTAVSYLSQQDDFFYIHAPICGRNDWYKIPASEFTKFTDQWNKAFPKAQITLTSINQSTLQC